MPYALRSCLYREPLSIVRSVEEDIEEMPNDVRMEWAKLVSFDTSRQER
jgi:hypothetical protein